MGRSGLLTTAALAIVVAIAIGVTAAQPVGSPWWINADADATYTASGIELAIGKHSFYLDHPGMPLQDLMAITFRARYAAHRLAGSRDSLQTYAGKQLVNLDESRPYFRGWAIVFFLFGAIVTFFAVTRLFGGPLWGIVGVLLWLSAPALPAMSIQFRPDGLLAGLVVACCALIARAAQKRDAWMYALAALLLGITITVKLHAAGLLVPFAIALLWRSPLHGWQEPFRNSLRRWLRRYRIPLIAFAVVWVALCTLFWRSQFPLTITPGQRGGLLELAAALAGYLLVVLALSRTKHRRGPFTPLGALLVSALTLGVVLPGTLFIGDLPTMLANVVGGLTGGGVNQGVTPFQMPLSTLVHGPLQYTTLMVCLAGVAAVVGVLRRDPFPMIWFSGALATGVMALARLGTFHYFESAFVLSIPAVLWLVRMLPAPVAAAAAVALVIVVVRPAYDQVTDAQQSATIQERQNRVYERLADRLLKRGQFALADSYASPTPDTRWYGLVHQYISWSPIYQYRFIPSDAGPQIAIDLGLRPAYFIGSFPTRLTHTQQVTVGFGSYVMQPLPHTFDTQSGVGAAKLLHGPGVDSPLG